jgi:ATP-dependent helicase/nuclease subunit A
MTRGKRVSTPDRDDRVSAATAFDRNVVVIAGAGTGKTSLLVERILTALGAGRLEIDRLGAMTFTERAAGEMRQRLAEGLERLLAAARPGHEPNPAHAGDRAFEHLAGRFGVTPPEVAARALRALRHLDRARVETIHTFCAGLLREHPLEAGVQPDFAVDPGEMQVAVLDELWERFVARELGSSVARPELWSRVLAPSRSLERLRELAYALASFSIPEELLSSAATSAIDRSETAELPMGSGVSRIDPTVLGDLVEAVKPFALEAREEMLRRGYVTFDGLLVLARNLLRDHAEVRESLKRRFLMLLVDEFQDTDPLQYEIVLYLGEKEGTCARAAYDAVLEPGRLFIVGDPKQSIYRFRGADYEAFQRAVSRILEGGGRLLRLTANFRSVPEVVEPVNALFSQPDSVCWKSSERQPDYDAISAVRPPAGGGGPRVEAWTVDAGPGALARDRREAEGKIVAEAIRRMVESGAARYDQITVLLRVFTQLSDYLRPLRELGVPFVVDGGKEFMARSEVGHLLVILKALARPSDPAALLAFLRSPVGAVPDTELTSYAAAGGRWQWREEVDAGEFPDLARAFGLLRKLDGDTRDCAADETVRHVLVDSELLTLSAAAFEGPQRVANLTKLAAAAAELARDGRLSLIEVVEALESGRTAVAVSDSPLADEQADAVRVMTIHKAKGLENDVVIIPDLAREDRKSYNARKVEVHVVRAASGEPSLAVKVDDVANPAWQRFVAEEIAHEQAQEVRVLYVGVTRARERLIVLAAPSRRIASWVEALASWGYEKGGADALLFGDKVTHRRCKAGARTHRGGAARPPGALEAVAAFERARQRARDSAAPVRRPSDEESWQEIREGSTERPTRRAGAARLSRPVGVAVHRLLEAWDGREAARLLEGIGPAARAAAEAAGESAEAVERDVREILSAFLGSELHERLGRVEVLGREIPIVEQAPDGAIYRGTLDLLYRERDGAYVVADYKTDRETDPGKLGSTYGPQLAVYARAVHRALGSLFPPRAELWMLRTAQRHVLDSK